MMRRWLIGLICACAVSALVGPAAAGAATAATTGSIAGVVTDASTHQPAGYIEVDVSNYGGGLVDSTCTAVDGTYSFTGLAPGQYTVAFDSSAALCQVTNPYLTQYYNDKPTAASADPVTVAAGATTNNIDAALQRGGEITGTVTDASSHAPLSDILAVIYDSSGTAHSDTCTAADGSYSFVGLTAGSYRVEFIAADTSACGTAATGNYAPQYYRDQTSLSAATPIAVSAGTVASGIDAAMTPGGEIQGTVTDASTHAAVANVVVAAYDASGEIIQSTCTAADGTYTLDSLATASYSVGFDISDPGVFCTGSPTTYVTQYYRDQPSLSQANPVAVTAGTATQSIDAALASGQGSISGTVTDASSGATLSGIPVQLFSSNTTRVLETTTASDGTYTFPNLLPGDYQVRFNSVGFGGNDNPNYQGQYWDDQPVDGTPDTIVVNSAPITSINAALVPSSAITGVVTRASDHAALANVEVDVYSSVAGRPGSLIGSTCTGTTGGYTLAGLAAGQYYVGFTPGTCGASTSYIPQFYENAASLASATPITVAAGSNTANIDAALAQRAGTRRLTIELLGPSGVGKVYVQGEGDVCASTCSYQFHTGVTLTLAASSRPHAHFVVWGGDCRSAGNSVTCRVTVTNNTTVTATFAGDPGASAPSVRLARLAARGRALERSR